tara:strand:+ start:7670 stop:8350 length:681 start_codon:yes stop_codon:yes gene_type:complete
MNVITKITTVALAASFLFPAYAEKNNESDKLDFTSERTAEKSLLFDREKGEEIQVLYFFSYGCPYCFKNENIVKVYQKYAANKPISFHYVPIEVSMYMKEYAKAYYMADSLKVDIHDHLFKNIHVNKKYIYNEDTLVNYFVENFDTDYFLTKNAYKSSFIKLKIMKNELLADKYHITSTPTLVIVPKNGDSYKLSPTINGNLLNMMTDSVKISEYILNNEGNNGTK